MTWQEWTVAAIGAATFALVVCRTVRLFSRRKNPCRDCHDCPSAAECSKEKRTNK